jgi:hypothetical protein
MNTHMNDSQLQTLEQVRQFLDGTGQIEFSIHDKADRYAFIQRALIRFGYNSLKKHDKGLLLRFLAHVSSYSYVQVKRLAACYLKNGRIQRKQVTLRAFKTKFTAQDCRLLARTDELHGTLSGPATKMICQRAVNLYDQPEYARLAEISVSHLYNLRKSKPYQRCRRRFDKTRSKPSMIGVRRQPTPNGQPGYIRVDTVHQGDLDKIKGVYHINAVDEVTQFEIVCSTQKISERFLIPILNQLLDQFPFVIKGFHADNGSEYINQVVARLLNKLLIELTKSRHPAIVTIMPWWNVKTAPSSENILVIPTSHKNMPHKSINLPSNSSIRTSTSTVPVSSLKFISIKRASRSKNIPFPP